MNTRTRLLLTFGLMAALGALGFIGLWLLGLPWAGVEGVHRQEVRRAMRAAEFLADKERDAMEQWAGNRRRELRLLAGSESLASEVAQGPSGRLDRRLEALRESLPGTYKYLCLVAPDGTLVSTSGATGAVAAGRMGELLLDAAVPGQTELLDLVPAEGRTNLIVINQVLARDREGNPTGKVQALLVADLELGNLLQDGELALRQSLGASGDVLLVDHQGQVIASALAALRADDLATVRQGTVAGTEGLKLLPGAGGGEILVVFRHVHLGTLDGLSLAVAQRMDEALAASRATFHRLAGLGVLVFLMAMGLIVFSANRIAAGETAIRTLNTSLEAELADRRRREDVILHVASGVSASTGDTFLHELARYLSQATEADVVLIAEPFEREGVPWARTLAFHLDGAPAPERDYPIPGSPCAEILGGTPYTLVEGLQARHPSFRIGQELGLQGYVGCPLLDASGRVRGMMAALTREPLAHPDEAASLLRIFSARAAAELERRTVEAERRDMETQMHHLQRMESVGRLAGGISHDMNNVLAAILSTAEVLQAREAAPAKQLDLILGAALRGRSLLKGLMEFSRKEVEDAIRFDLNELVRKEADLLASTTLQRIQVDLSLAPGLPRVLGSPTALATALMNLCVNAVDAMADRGVLTLRTEALEGPAVGLTVEDTGQGMPPEVVSRAMEPFFTTKPAGKGTGLGLAMVFGTVKAHGGTVSIQSQPGHGTQIRIVLPAAPGEGLPGPDATAQAGLPPLPALDILLVDDDDLVRHTSAGLLEAAGHTVTPAGGGYEALGLVEHGAGWDLVILDLNMPGLDGFETLTLLRRLKPSQPVLVVSGYADTDTRARLEALHPVAILAKPYSGGEFEDAVRRLLSL